MRFGSSLTGAALLLRLPLLLIYVGLPLLLVGVSVCWSTFRTDRSTGESARQARRGRLEGSAVGAAIGVSVTLVGQALLAPAAVALGYLAGVLVTELRGAPVPEGPVRIASLQPRSATRYLPRWLGPTAAGLALVAVLAPLAFALLPRLPEQHTAGRLRYSTGLAGPSWPPAGLSVPLAAVAVLALVAGALLLRRVPLRPTSTSAPGVDEQVRQNAARGIGGAVLGTELLVLAALTILGSEGLDTPQRAGTAYAVSRVMVTAGIALAALALVAWIATGWWRRVPPAAATDSSSA